MKSVKTRIRFILSLTFLLSATLAFGQSLTVGGTVTDKEKEPLIGVTVKIRGGKALGVTDLDGRYRVVLDAPATLTFSYVGMQPVDLPVKRSGEMNVEMQPASTALDDVVVVGYGTQRKINLTGKPCRVSAERNFPTAVCRRYPPRCRESYPV